MEGGVSSFDLVVDRKNTDSIKYDFAKEAGMPDDAIPLWVADMDFRVPDQVLDALHSRIDHGIFGYTDVKEEYFLAVAGWFASSFGFLPLQEWLIKSPGVVFALNQVVRALTKEGDAVLIQQPVYHPFSAAILNNRRKLVDNSLVYQNGRYEIDFDDFEEKIIRNQVKLFILCSPHNPVGRVWTVKELLRMGEICLSHGVVVVSDEIHCDFTFEGKTHTVFAGLSKELENNCVVCTAPSKTFNLAGLQVSNIFIPNEALRTRVKEQFKITGYGEINTLGLTACRAAYLYGKPWLSELKAYLKGNLDFIREYLRENIPQIILVEPEGTYLLWLDCSGLGLTDKELKQLMYQEAGVWLDLGSKFGENCGQFFRLNMTSSQSILKKAMERLKEAVCKRRRS